MMAGERIGDGAPLAGDVRREDGPERRSHDHAMYQNKVLTGLVADPFGRRWEESHLGIPQHRQRIRAQRGSTEIMVNMRAGIDSASH